MTQQPWEIYNSGSGSTADDMCDEDMPFLSSQGSTVSDVSIVTPNGGQKRRFFEDEDEVIENGTGGRALGERVLAVPKRKKWSSTKAPDTVAIFGQENLGFSTGQDVDFEDADFLDYALITDDLEMSG